MAKRQPSLPWSNADFSALVDSYSRNEGLDTLDQLLNGHVLKIIKDCDFEVKLGSQSVSSLLTGEVSTSKAIESSIRRLLSKIVGYLKAPKRNIDNIKCLLAAPFSEPKLAKRQKIDIPAPVEAPVKEPLLKLKTDCEKCPTLRKNLTTATASLKESLKSLRHSNIKIRKKFKVKRINQERRRKEECISNLKKTVRDLTTKNALLSREVRSLQKLSTSHMLGKIQKEQRRIRDLRSQLAAKEQRIQSLKLDLEEKEMKVINLEMMIHEKEEEMATFLQKERTEKTEKHKKQRVYGSTIRKCLYQCLLSQVPVEKAGPLLGNLWTNITGDSIVTPGPSTVAQMAYELGVLSDIQIGEHLNRCSHATIAWDATSLEGVHVNEIHICVEQGLFTLQIGDLPGGRTEDYFQHISNALTDIAHTYSKYTQEPIAEVLERFYDGITSTLSDRAPVNNCVASELSVLVNKQLIILNCNVHPLDGLASTTRQTLKSIDSQLQIHSGIYGNEGRAANLLYAISKLRYKDGPGDPAGFKTFLESQKIKPGVIVRYRGNRLHILFHLAGVVVMLRDKLVLYLKKYCASAKLRLAILADLENDLIFLQLQILGLLGKTLTGPWMTLFYKNAEKKKHLEMIPFMRKCLLTLGKLEQDPNYLLTMDVDIFGSPFVDDATMIALRSISHTQHFHTITCSVVSAMKTLLERQLKPYLDGPLASPSPLLMERTQNAPVTNMHSERTLGMFDSQSRRAPNATIGFVDGKVKSKLNKTLDWLSSKPKEIQDVMISFSIGHAAEYRKCLAKRSTAINQERLDRQIQLGQKRDKTERKKVERELKNHLEQDSRENLLKAFEEHQHTFVDSLLVGNVDALPITFYHIWDVDGRDTVYTGTIKGFRTDRKGRAVQIEYNSVLCVIPLLELLADLAMGDISLP